jgi:hypothetical protein
MRMLIEVYNGMDAQLTYSSLENYLEKLEHDKRTRYDGDPRWCAEDAEFLVDAIARVRSLLENIRYRHPKIVQKG